MADFTALRDDLCKGSVHADFTVTDVLPIPEFAATGYVMRHGPSGARALWIACADTNKSFAIAFKTPPANDTGVFHILEHSVLCGSERFPVKEPFVNLLKTSMQTFLNALTFSDKTMYPVASTNIQDLENLMDVYLDAVLHPAIYVRKRIFEQEGWHLEVDPEDNLAYNGVVFNEMKGATSDPDDMLYLGIDRALFPDTPYSFESGGDPRAIPTLTYEEFLDNHARHYDPSNSYIILYGDMDIDRELAFVDERLKGATRRTEAAPNPLFPQKPIRAPFTRVEMATAPENAAVALAYVIGQASDRERVLATDILLDSIAGSNECPLKRRVLDADLADDFTASLVDGELQPRIVFTLKGAKEGVAEKFRTLVEDTCRELADAGIERDLLRASIAQTEFVLREQDTGGYPTGVTLSVLAMSSWLYDDERPIDYLRFEDALANMKEGLERGYFESLLRQLVCESEHCAEVELVCVEEGAAAEEAAELARLRAQMSDEDIAAIRSEMEALRFEQESPDRPEDLAKLPHLHLSDITDPVPETPAVLVDAPLPCLYHDIETRRIDYICQYFDLSHLAFDELPYVSILATLLGRLPTKSHTAAELDTLVQLNLGMLNFFCESPTKFDEPDYCQPLFVVNTSVLSENVRQAARIPSEVWGTTLFEDTDRMLDILMQRRISHEQHFVNRGHSAAVSQLDTHWTASAKAQGAMSGIESYLFLKDLLASWDERKDDLCRRLEDLSAKVFTASNVLVSFTGPVEDRLTYWEEANTLGLEARDLSETHLEVGDLVPMNEAFVIPSNVCFVAGATAPTPLRETDRLGTWSVAGRVLSYDYLWNEVRVKGGAYGTGFSRSRVGSRQFWSFRDPGIDATLERYDQAAAWLSSWDPSQEEMDGYVVSSVAVHDAPTRPRMLARRQDASYILGLPADWRDKVRAEKLATTASDIRALASALEDFHRTRHVCVFGPREAIEASGVEFTHVQDLMG